MVGADCNLIMQAAALIAGLVERSKCDSVACESDDSQNTSLMLLAMLSSTVSMAMQHVTVSRLQSGVVNDQARLPADLSKCCKRDRARAACDIDACSLSVYDKRRLHHCS